jgi:hypothetical protein
MKLEIFVFKFLNIKKCGLANSPFEGGKGDVLAKSSYFLTFFLIVLISESCLIINTRYTEFYKIYILLVKFSDLILTSP